MNLMNWSCLKVVEAVVETTVRVVVEVTHAEVIQVEVIQAEVIQAEVIQVEVIQAEVTQAEVIQVEVIQAEVIQADVIQAEVIQMEVDATVTMMIMTIIQKAKEKGKKREKEKRKEKGRKRKVVVSVISTTFWGCTLRRSKRHVCKGKSNVMAFEHIQTQNVSLLRESYFDFEFVHVFPLLKGWTSSLSFCSMSLLGSFSISKVSRAIRGPNFERKL